MGNIFIKNIEATKITSDWYLWMHHTIDNIPTIMKRNMIGKKTFRKFNRH